MQCSKKGSAAACGAGGAVLSADRHRFPREWWSDARHYQIAALSTLLVFNLGWLDFGARPLNSVLAITGALVTQAARTGFDNSSIFTGQRNVDIGAVELKDAWAWGFSGVMVRGSGAAWDLRKAQPYECYSEFDFDIPVGRHGDCYDRYLVRMEEMRQSVRIMKQCLDSLRSPEGQGPVAIKDYKIMPPPRAARGRLRHAAEERWTGLPPTRTSTGSPLQSTLVLWIVQPPPMKPTPADCMICPPFINHMATTPNVELTPVSRQDRVHADNGYPIIRC